MPETITKKTFEDQLRDIEKAEEIAGQYNMPFNRQEVITDRAKYANRTPVEIVNREAERQKKKPST